MRILVALAWLLTLTFAAYGQQPSQRPTANMSVKITTPLTYQLIAPLKQSMQSLTIQNNNPMSTSEMCYIDVSGAIPIGATTGGVPTGGTGTPIPGSWAGASVLLPPGASYTRYYPYIPQGPIVATCGPGLNDSLYVDWQ
jgi:hypothetical protein